MIEIGPKDFEKTLAQNLWENNKNNNNNYNYKKKKKMYENYKDFPEDLNYNSSYPF